MICENVDCRIKERNIFVQFCIVTFPHKITKAKMKLELCQYVISQRKSDSFRNRCAINVLN